MDKNKISSIVFYFSILLFIISFGFAHNPPGGWYQQFLPMEIGNAFLTDITFTDSLTGYAVTDANSSQVSYILKTTNGGDNWSVKLNDYREFTKVHFLNNDTGFAGTYWGTGGARFYRTTNAGLNWNFLNNPNGDFEYQDFHILNMDTIWATYYGVFGGGIYRTTNGGQNWANQYYVFGNNPNKIYMYNKDIGFMYNEKDSLFKTTNSGLNWFRVSGGGFGDMHFINATTGWKCYGHIQKTTDGGNSWRTLPLPPKSNTITISRINKFSIVNKDTIWGVGSVIFLGPGLFRGLIYKSTNSGETWGYQLPDTSIINIFQYQHVQFINKSIGWAYTGSKGIHTITGGGDTTFYTGIIQTSTELPTRFELKQNYPNPFNPRTVIPYKIKSASYVRLTAYDMLGKETQRLVDQFQNAGEYEVDFMGKYGASGVYFYRIEVEDNRSGKVFSATKRMMLLK